MSIVDVVLLIIAVVLLVFVGLQVAKLVSAYRAKKAKRMNDREPTNVSDKDKKGE